MSLDNNSPYAPPAGVPGTPPSPPPYQAPPQTPPRPAAVYVQPPVKRTKNKFWTVVWSLIPGAGQMYQGQMKKGISLMLLFAGIIAVAAFTYLAILTFLLPVIWFYSFFDAWNKYHLPEDKLAKVRDDFLFFLNAMPENVRSDPRFKKVASANVLKIGGIVAIIAGAYLIWDQIIVNVLSRLLSETGAGILSEVSYRLPQVAVAVLLIVIGVKLITHKKRELDSENNDSEEEDK